MVIRRFLPIAFVLASTASAASASADDGVTYEKKNVEGPQYTAPLYQLTQPSYVPQSVALSGPSTISDWNPREPVPPGYRPVSRARRGLLITGASILGSLYMLAVLAGGTDKSLTPLYVPVFGPFLQIATGHDSGSGANGVLVLDGLGQTAGAVMLLIAATTTKTVLVRNDLAEVRIAPTVTKTGSGIGLVGRF
jgi:hypothetical protein